jgi:succinate dehydrogenase / fumarate reductase, iron-sulfur subunit
MLINGQAAMACSSLIDKLDQPIRLEPLSRFPIVRDLSVDRSILFENLKRVYQWVPIDGTYPLGPGPRIDPATQELAFPLSRCMSCCLCMEVCPQFNESTHFAGAAIINQVRLFNMHPTGTPLRHQRLDAMMGEGGIHECSYAGNCVQICPKNIPLTASISIVNGQVIKQAIGDLLQKPELTSATRNRDIAESRSASLWSSDIYTASTAYACCTSVWLSLRLRSRATQS